MASQGIIWNLIRQSPLWLTYRLVPEFLMGGSCVGHRDPDCRLLRGVTPAAELWQPTLVNFLGQN